MYNNYYIINVAGFRDLCSFHEEEWVKTTFILHGAEYYFDITKFNPLNAQ
jgi:hypothetical protein